MTAWKRIVVLPVLCMSAAVCWAEQIPFDSDRWVLYNAEVVELDGRQGLIGSAFLPNIVFENGIIEFDAMVDGSRGYPGITFRGQSELAYENFYFRPHVPNRPDALQYTPVFNGVAGWQLYNGPGFTAAAPIPQNEWIHVRVEILGRRARVFFGEGDAPDLVIDELKHDPAAGSVGIRSARNRGAVFADFRVTKTDELDFGPEPMPVHPRGLVRQWELSRPFKFTEWDLEIYPDFAQLEPGWQTVTAEPGGLLDIARHVPRDRMGEPEMVFAKLEVKAAAAGPREFTFGYSDIVGVFLNGQLLFTGNSAYLSRDETFSGIIGLFDTLYLPLRQGHNELMFVVVEGFGGWGLMGQDNSDDFFAPGMTRQWRRYAGNCMPEAVVYDPERDVLLVSQYLRGGQEFISRVGMDGEVLQAEWITGLSRPTGLAITDGVLWAVTRGELVRIDLQQGEVLEKLAIPGAGFPNDVAIDQDGSVYVSDTRAGCIHRFGGGQWEVWLQGEQIDQPNGLLVDGGELLFGNGGDGALKAADLEDRTIRTIARLGDGSNPDGLQPAGSAGWIVSDFNGRIFLVARDGGYQEILNTTASGGKCADLAYLPDQQLLVVPGLYDNQLTAYRYAASQ